MLQVLYHHSITMTNLLGLRLHPPLRRQKMMGLPICLSITLLNVERSLLNSPISPRRRWTTETILIPLDSGRFVVVHPCSTFWDRRQLATPQNTEVNKMVKFGVFRCQRVTKYTSRDEIWRIRIDCASTLAHQIWPSSVKQHWYRSPPYVKICPKLWFLAKRRRHNEHIQMRFGVSA